MFDLRCATLLVLAGALSLTTALADSPSVTAVLSNSEAAVGETVRLQIRVTGSGAKPPEQIKVDGLEIQRTGTEQHYEMLNFSVSQSVTYNYTVLPIRPGKFKIPPQTVQMGSNTFRTQELTLTVSDSAGGSTRSNPSAAQQSTVDPKKVGFIELVVPKREAYVGEIIPVVVKLCLNARVRFQQIEPPEIKAQGLTMQKLEKGSRDMETINGATYDVTTFKTAIAAARTGKFEIPGLESKALALLPQRDSSNRNTPRRRSPFDMFNIDPFNDPLFGDLRMVEPQRITLQSEPATLEVKPLPPNAPANFSGAVGNFTLTTEANPKSVQVGDPITVKSTIAGRGNFDRVTAPGLEDDRGWHKYPPSSKFQKDDDVGISGTKTFEMVLSPNEKKQAVPPLTFAYFDPAKEQYVTLRSEAIPVKVEGNALPSAATSTTAATAAASAQSSPAAPGSSTPATRKPQDILYQVTDFGRPQSFTPLYARPIFWMTQLIPFLALLGFAAWKIRQARIDNRDAQRTAALQHEAADLMRKLRRDDSSPQEYFSQASRAIQVKTALARKVDPNAVDEEVAAKTFTLGETERAQLRRLFARNDELRYSGAKNGSGSISRQDRHEVLELIENLRA
ncbi:MAG: hypothetical protein QOI22_1588 [Verrucomicrobiota bacterium]